MRRSVVAIVSGVLALGVVGTYIVLDIEDRVPGILTNAQAATPQAPPALSPQSGLSLPAIVGGWTGTDDPESAPGTPVNASQVSALWADSAKAAEDGHWTTWAMVVDAASNQTLLDADASQAHTPASVTKTLTARAALEDLDASSRLSTGTSLDGQTLFLWGQGDLLLSRGASDPDAVNGRAGVETLAQDTARALKERGLGAVTLNWQANPFPGPDHHPDWDRQGYGEFGGHVAAFAFNAGRISEADYGFVDDPARTVADQLAEDLRGADIDVTLGQAGPAPGQAQQLAQVSSATVGQQIRWMLWHSDNTLAEQYCRLAAQHSGVEASFEGATAHVVDTLKQAGVPTGGLVLHDCSGLSEGNRISAQTLTVNLRTSLMSDKPAVRDLVRSLPWAGLNGTMDTRLNDGAAAANAQAKTGSLPGVSSLTGVVTTKSGRLLIFALGTDQVPNGAAALTRPWLDNVVEGLAELN